MSDKQAAREDLAGQGEPDIESFAINPLGGPDIIVDGHRRFVGESDVLAYKTWAKQKIASLSPDPSEQGESVPEASLHAAMDAFYPGEDWRNDLGCALESSLRDMRAALRAGMKAAPAPSRPADRPGLAQSHYELLRECQSEFRALGCKGLAETIGAQCKRHLALRDAPRDGGDGTQDSADREGGR